MKLIWMIVLVLGAAGVGAGGLAAYDNYFMDKELRTQLADKDKMISALNDDITGLKQGLGSLQDKNKAVLDILASSGKDVAALSKNNQTAQDKLASVIVRVVKMVSDMREQLQTAAP